MIKRVTLTLFKGNFEQGFPALLRIDNTMRQVIGRLPPCHKILDFYEKWRSDYYQMVLPQARIKAKSNQITYISRRSSGNELANHLNKWLNSGECDEWRKIRDGLQQNLNKEDEIHLIIQTEDIQLRRLPWHAWNLFSEYYTKTEIALGSTEYQPPQNSHVPLIEKVRILAILGDSTGINVDKDKNLLEQLPHAETKFLPQPEREQLNEDLWDQPWQILFFAGHSSSQTDGKTGQLYINSTDVLELDDLKEALRKAVEQGLQLAIFNSCDGLGLAQELADLHIPQIIVMREAVPDQIAQKFLQYFLKSFSVGNSLYSAVREARLKLRILEKDFPFASWLPVVCQNPAVEEVPTWDSLYNSTVDRANVVPPQKPLPVPEPVPRRQKRLKLPTVLGISLAVSCLVMGVRSLRRKLYPADRHEGDNLGQGKNATIRVKDDFRWEWWRETNSAIASAQAVPS